MLDKLNKFLSNYFYEISTQPLWMKLTHLVIIVMTYKILNHFFGA